MSTFSATASLDFCRSSGYWQGEGTASQGIYDGSTRTGVIAFPTMNLANKIIKSVTLTISTSSSGGNWNKVVNVYRSNYQGYIDTSKNGTQYRGVYLGDIQGVFYDNTISNIDVTSILSSTIALGQNNFVIYSSDSSNYGGYEFSYNYLKWSTVTITVTYDEGLVYISNGSSFDAYEVYIDNGSSWDRYIPYMDNGSSWDICG